MWYTAGSPTTKHKPTGIVSPAAHAFLFPLTILMKTNQTN